MTRLGRIERFEGVVIGEDVGVGDAVGGVVTRRRILLRFSGGGLRCRGMARGAILRLSRW